MRILACISEDFYFLSHRKELLLGLSSAGYRVELATNFTTKEEAVRESGIPVHQVNLRRKSLSPFSVCAGALAYRRLINKLTPDVVFAVALKPILAATLCRFLGTSQPTLCAFAGLGTAFSDGLDSIQLRLARVGMEALFPFLLRNSSCHTLFQNGDDHRFFTEKRWVEPHQSYVIPGAGVPLERFLPKQWFAAGPDPVRFLFAGRLLWEKGLREIGEACEILRQRGLMFKCHVAGLPDTTNKRAVPLSFVESHDQKGNFEWLGPRNDIPELMSNADCFIFPSSYREGVPRVLLEASAAGLPMITTDMPGCREVVKNSGNGLLIKPKDSAALANAMEYCIRNREQLPVWGRAARQRAENEFSIEKVIEGHIAIMENILSARRIRSGIELGGRTQPMNT